MEIWLTCWLGRAWVWCMGAWHGAWLGAWYLGYVYMILLLPISQIIFTLRYRFITRKETAYKGNIGSNI